MFRSLAVAMCIGCATGCTHEEVAETPPPATLVVDAHRQLKPFLLGELPVAGSSQKQVVQAERYVIRNGAEGDVSLKFKESTCGCVRVDLDGSSDVTKELIVRAGEQVAVTLSFDVPRNVGVYAFTVRFDVKGETETHLSLDLGAEVFADLAATPAALNPVLNSADGARTEIVTVVQRCRSIDPPRGSLEVKSSHSAARVARVMPLDAATQFGKGLWVRKWEVRLAIDPAKLVDANPVSGLLDLQVPQDGKRVRKEVPVSLRRQMPVEAPTRVAFGVAALHNTVSRKILVRSGDGAKFRVTGAVAESPAFHVKDAAESALGEHWLTLEFEPTTAGEAKSRVLLRTDHPLAPELAVHVSGTGQ